MQRLNIVKCGRKPRPITNEERKIVIQTYKEIITGATMIEQYLDEKGIHINHNRIHRILLEAKLAREEQKKILDSIDQLAQKPELGKELVGRLTGLKSLRAGIYKAIYKIEDTKLIVFKLKSKR